MNTQNQAQKTTNTVGRYKLSCACAAVTQSIIWAKPETTQ